MKNIDDTKVISLGAFIVATIVLIVIALRDANALADIYWIYCLAFAGLKISKGIVTTFQKRDELINQKDQKYEYNDDIERDFDAVIKRSNTELEVKTNR